MARRISTVFGCALRPGVSRNKRLYTKEMIAAAVAEAQGRIQSGDAEFLDRTKRKNSETTVDDFISQRTHHAAEDDSTRIVGRLTSLTLNENGDARFSADLADTPHARTIDSLVRPKQGNDPDEVEAFLKGVSIRGAWVGNVRTVMHNGEMVETADGLVIDGLDYTGRPGVIGAEIDGYMSARSLVGARESAGRVPIYESIMEGQVETVTVQEKDAPAVVAEAYADLGYRGMKRYPLDTVRQSKAAWSRITETEDAQMYTAAQLKRIKGRIKAAFKKFGVEVSPDERWLISRGVVTESGRTYENDPVPALESRSAHFNVTLDNGMVCVTVASCHVDPHDLDALGRAAMAAACAALDKLDPDCDGDMDVPGALGADTDEDMTETETPATEVTEEDQTAPEPVADETPREEPAVSEPIVTPASEAPAAVTTTETPATQEPTAVDALSAKFDALTAALTSALTALVPRTAPAESAPVAPVVEAAPVVTETEDQRISRLVAEQVAAQRTALIQELAESGQGVGRKGLVAPVRETAAVASDDDLSSLPNWPTENGEPLPAHKLTKAQWQKATGAHLEQAVMRDRSVYRQR